MTDRELIKTTFSVSVPIVEEMDYRRLNVYEHPSVYPHKEYPRYVRPVGANQPRTKTVYVKAYCYEHAVEIALQKERTKNDRP